MKIKSISMPLSGEAIAGLSAGDEVLFSGTIYTARDQAHSLMFEAIRAGKELPVDLKGQIIYFCGPAKTPPGRVIGSCGPTTSKRMDKFSPELLKAGLFGMIGKGSRNTEVVEAVRKYRGIYFLAYAGCGALISRYVKQCRCVAYHHLGPEAVYKLEVRDLPLIVGIDSKGRDIYARLKI